MTSTWRTRARAVIEMILAEHRALSADEASANELVARDAELEGRHDEARAIRRLAWTIAPEDVLAKIDAAYPFGERKYHPYKCWLQERRVLIERLFKSADPLERRCPACGAGPGKACRPFFLEQEPMHEARRAVVDQGDDGPLWGGG